MAGLFPSPGAMQLDAGMHLDVSSPLSLPGTHPSACTQIQGE